MFGLDVLAGSLVIGGIVGTVMALATYAMSRSPADDAAFPSLVRETSDRYIMASVTAWEFARGKLRGDPIYRATVCDRAAALGRHDRRRRLRPGADAGAARRRDQALFAPARGRGRGRRRRDSNGAIGIELRRRAAAVARQALAGRRRDRRGGHPDDGAGAVPAVLFFDVLHMMPTGEQEAVIAATVSMLEPGGVMLVREADAAARMAARVRAAGQSFEGARLRRLAPALFLPHRRRMDRLLSRSHGLAAEVRPMTSGAFSNVLLRVTKSG